MTTSGSTNFTQTKNQLILDAYQILGIYGVGRTISSEDMTFASSMLNKMVKSWGTKGLHLWCKEEGVLYLDQYASEYSLGSASTDAYCTTASDEIITQTSGVQAAAATSIVVDSTSGMAANDYIGIVLDSNDIHWSTISSVTDSTTLVIANALPSASSGDNNVYTFTNRITKPLRIISARLTRGYDAGSTSTRYDTILGECSYQDYFNLPSKDSNGIPVQYHYNPKLDSGKMYLFPRPNDCEYRVRFTFERIIEDLDNTSDNFDFPGEWLEPLTYQLALRLGPAFGKDQRTMSVIGPMATALLENLMAWDTEITGFSMMPDDEV